MKTYERHLLKERFMGKAETSEKMLKKAGWKKHLSFYYMMSQFRDEPFSEKEAVRITRWWKKTGDWIK